MIPGYAVVPMTGRFVFAFHRRRAGGIAALAEDEPATAAFGHRHIRRITERATMKIVFVYGIIRLGFSFR